MGLQVERGPGIRAIASTRKRVTSEDPMQMNSSTRVGNTQPASYLGVEERLSAMLRV
jgi:hypothetical protein